MKSETAINSTHTNYNISSYNCEMDYRSKKKGGGVSPYIMPCNTNIETIRN